MENQNDKQRTQKLALAAILTALVAVLQFLGAFTHIGPFSVSLVLIPIVIGAALCGWQIGAWLGLIFGITVLLSGDASSFLAVSVPGTVGTVLVKGIACGAAAGAVYKLFERRGRYIAVIIAAVVCPIVNTGIFLIGCAIFFIDTLAGWASATSFGGDIVKYMLFVLVGGNFLFELVSNILLSPAAVRIIDAATKSKKKE